MISFKQYLFDSENRAFDPKLAYHNELNPAIWLKTNGHAELKPEVQVKLQTIADEFIEFLGVSAADVTDVILTGSNANYNWTDISDIDLHLVVDMSKGKDLCPTCPSDDFIADCFQAKKTLWNSTHKITIYGYDVELYAQSAGEQAVIGSGIYSIKQQAWLKLPKHQEITIDNTLVQMKAQDIMDQIDELINSSTNDLDELNGVKEKIQKLRASGLRKGGEFSIENLAFKALRNLGFIEKLKSYISALHDNSLSLK